MIDRLSKLILIGESSSFPSISPINRNISLRSQASQRRPNDDKINLQVDF